MRRSSPTSYNFIIRRCGEHVSDMNLRAITDSSIYFLFIFLLLLSVKYLCLPLHFPSNICLKSGHFPSGPPQQISIVSLSAKVTSSQSSTPLPSSSSLVFHSTPPAVSETPVHQTDATTTALNHPISLQLSPHSLIFAPHTPPPHLLTTSMFTHSLLFRKQYNTYYAQRSVLRMLPQYLLNEEMNKYTCMVSTLMASTS